MSELWEGEHTCEAGTRERGQETVKGHMFLYTEAKKPPLRGRQPP